jgi:hypothetical protein
MKQCLPITDSSLNYRNVVKTGLCDSYLKGNFGGTQLYAAGPVSNIFKCNTKTFSAGFCEPWISLDFMLTKQSIKLLNILHMVAHINITWMEKYYGTVRNSISTYIIFVEIMLYTCAVTSDILFIINKCRTKQIEILNQSPPPKAKVT